MLLLSSSSASTPLLPRCKRQSSPTKVLDARPLGAPHDGTSDTDEQGVFVAAVLRASPAPAPIPLHEFPMLRGGQPADYGPRGDQGKAWGYHFGRAFAVAPHPHFEWLSRAGRVLNDTAAAAANAPVAAAIPGGTAAAAAAAVAAVAETRWLGNSGPWGVPGWSAADGVLAAVLSEVEAAGGCGARAVLELGTSRGRTAAALARAGCAAVLPTVDVVDRGPALNLMGLGVRVVSGTRTITSGSTRARTTSSWRTFTATTRAPGCAEARCSRPRWRAAAWPS
jgi:hypothetical protein